MENNTMPQRLVDMDMPLAEIVRPKTLSEYIGQEHLLSTEDGLILNFYRLNYLPSMVLSGPPGVGKTTLARLLADDNNYVFVEFSATDSTVGDLKELSDAIAAENKKRAARRLARLRVLVFIDEIHRFTTTQQDYLLPFIECGLFVFVGATTVNPSQRLRRAILSRCQLFELKPLGLAHVRQVVGRAALFENIRRKIGAGLQFLHFSDDAIEVVSRYANGDMRSAINFVEVIGSNFRSSNYLITNHAREIAIDEETATRICRSGQASALESTETGVLLRQLHLIMKSEWDTDEDCATKRSSENVTKSESVVHLRDSDEHSKESDEKIIEWERHMAFSDDSDVEPVNIYSDSESSDTSELEPSRNRVVSALHTLLVLLQKNEDPLMILKSLVLFTCKNISSDEYELPKIMAAMKSIQNTGAGAKHVLAEVIERLTQKKKLREELDLEPIKEYFRSLPQKSEEPDEAHELEIVYDEKIADELLSEVPEETVHGNMDVELTPWEELEGNYTLGS